MNEGLLASDTLAIPPTPIVNTALLAQDARTRQQDVIVSVLYVVFLVDAGFWFVAPTMMGSAAYFLYTAHALPSNYWLVPFCVLGTTLIIAYCVLMTVRVRDQRSGGLVISALLLWQLSCMPLVGMASALLGNTALLQLCMIFSSQSMAVVVATEVKRHEIDLLFNGLLMLVASCLCMLVGVYAFLAENDLWSALGILCVSLLSIGYKLATCRWASARFMATPESKLEAVRCFYTDAVCWWQWLYS
jgi:hypothetical protein